VSPPGGDFSEPVTQHSKRFTRTFWALDKDLAGARHFPAINWLESYSGYLENVTDWWDSQLSDVRWSDLRARAMQILQEDDRLQKIVRLIGPDALPDREKLVYEIARVIKEAFLQQNAFDKVDSFCSSQKQLRLMQLILHFYERAKGCLAKQIPVSKILELPCLLDILRAKVEIPNEELDRFERLFENVDSEFDRLEKRYEREGA
jgi:V/A-type H+-transporting ATPase subunit A